MSATPIEREKIGRLWASMDGFARASMGYYFLMLLLERDDAGRLVDEVTIGSRHLAIWRATLGITE